MWKLDSILREALRYHPLTPRTFGILITFARIPNFSLARLNGPVTMHRKAMKDITLYDGTRIPRGTIITLAAGPMHHDEALLENAKPFDPFRYARMRSAGISEA